jgi:diacylglycerol kinase
VHLIAATAVLALAAILALPPSRWCLLILCIGLVISMELFNSALEVLVRTINHGYDTALGRALDVASGAVLAAALAAAATGCLVFGEAMFFPSGTR